MAEIAHNIVTPHFQTVWEFGPLMMDNQESRATLFGVDLELPEQEYNALFLLAQRPGETMAFEELYAAAFEPPDHTDRRSEAIRCLETILRKVNARGGKNVWIECRPGGYQFHITTKNLF